MKNLNYTVLLHGKIEEFSNQFPDYTYGDILYSALRMFPDVTGKHDIRSLSAEDIYKAITKALDYEKEQ